MKLIYITALLTALTITVVIMYPQYAEMRIIQQYCDLISFRDRQENNQSSDRNTHFWHQVLAEKNNKKDEKQYLKCMIIVTRKGL